MMNGPPSSGQPQRASWALSRRALAFFPGQPQAGSFANMALSLATRRGAWG